MRDDLAFDHFPCCHAGLWIFHSQPVWSCITLNENVSVPKPGNFQALVRVFGSGVNPVNVVLVELICETFVCSLKPLAQTSWASSSRWAKDVVFSWASRVLRDVCHEVCPTIQPCCRVQSARGFSVLPLTAWPHSGKSADCVSTLESVRGKYGSLSTNLPDVQPTAWTPWRCPTRC